MNNSSELEVARQVIKAVTAAGGRALFVGGWVRDRLLNRRAKDIDIEVYGLTAGRLGALLESIGQIDAVGESFTVYKLGPLDISLPRRESKTGRGHRGFKVTGDPNMSIEEASSRRDFTVNAIAWDPLSEEYLDPHCGIQDLNQGLLRMVNPNTFSEDSLRVLRAVQFAARFQWQVDEATKTICKKIPLDDLPSERIWGEFEKLMIQASKPSIGFVLARELGVIKKLFPGLDALVGCEQEPEWHPEGDVWVHNLLVIDQAASRKIDLPYPQQVALMLGALCHDLGKPATTAFIDGRIRSRNHEEAGVEPTRILLDRLNIHTMNGYDVRAQVIGLVAHHLKPGMWHRAPNGVGDGAFFRLARKVDLELLARLAVSDCLGRTGTFDCTAMDWFLERSKGLLKNQGIPEPFLRGRHVLALGLPPGPKVGQILKQVYERQIDGEVSSLAEAIVSAKNILGKTEGN